MAGKQKELPAEVKRLRGRLLKWRGERRRGQRIPEELWVAAVRAARRHGLNHVSRALAVNYYQLKRRLGQAEEPSEARTEAGAAFMELPARRAEGDASCVVELEKGNGAKLRVSVTDASTVDWAQVKEAFLGA